MARPGPSDWPKPKRSPAAKRKMADARLAGRASKERWPIPAAAKAQLAQMVVDLAHRPGLDPRDRLRAAQVAVTMEGQNLQDQQDREKNLRLDEGRPTERIVGVVIPPPTMPPE